jgi:hypothetical protein
MSHTTGCPCEALDKRNTERREGLKTKTGKESKSQAVVGKKDANGEPTGEGTTVSSMCFTAHSDRMTSAHNSQKALANADNGFVSGQDAAKRKTGESNLCPEAEHKHDPPHDQKSAHTEARLLDDLGKREGGFPTSGALTLKIDWRPNGKGGKSSPMPCPSCHKLLCAAKECGVDVFLCDEKNEKKRLKEGEHCPANSESYERLAETMRPTRPKVG